MKTQGMKPTVNENDVNQLSLAQFLNLGFAHRLFCKLQLRIIVLCLKWPYMQQGIHQKVGKNLMRPTFSRENMIETQPHISELAGGE